MTYLDQPLVYGRVNLKNRLVMPPMATAKAGPDGSVSKEMINYYYEKAHGGYISLIIIEHSYISVEGKASERQLSIGTDSDSRGLRKLSDIIHQCGSKTVMQINHAGSAAGIAITGVYPKSPSEVANPRNGILPREMTIKEIDEIVLQFRDAAVRVRKAGFDGVEIHSAHGYLLNQFFSPLTNKRNDEYGGDVTGRIRIHLEIIKAIREAVGNDFLILLRLGASDYTPGGSTLEDSMIAAPEFEKAGVDLLDISGGFCGYTDHGLSGQGFFAPLTQALKQVVSIPVLLTGGITDAAAAELLLSEGKTDLIGVGRAIYYDSKWAEKAMKP
jgi:2,4-dienoyl-CoA reductase-like NADH-dependent reductase (Old Yellow Enzyme family)